MNEKQKIKDDYLWDGTGETDPEVQRMESALKRFRHNPELHPAPAWPEEASLRRSKGWPKWINVPRLAPALAIAALVFALLLNWRWPHAPQPVGPPQAWWEVSRLAGAPQIGANRISEVGRLEVGQLLETDASSRANITVGKIG